MKIKYLYITMLAAALCGCAEDYLSEVPADESGSQTEIPETCVPMTINFSAETEATRTSTSGLFTHWADGDKIGVFSPEAYYEWENSYIAGKLFYNAPSANICLDVKSGFGTPSAVFGASKIYDGEVIKYTGRWGWNTKYDVHNFYAYYPYVEASKALTPYGAVPFALPSIQKQRSSGDTEHIAALDFLYASASMDAPEDIADKTPVEGDVIFDFKHAFSLLKMTVRNGLSDTVTITGIEVASEDAPLAGNCTVDLSSGAVTPGKTIDASGNVVDGGRGFSSQVELTDEVRLAKNGTAVLNLMVFPGAHTVSGLEITVKTSAGIQTFTSKKVLESGVTYTKTMALSTSGIKPLPTYDLQVVDFESANASAMASNIGGANFYTDFASWEDSATGLLFSNNSGTYTLTGSNYMYDGGLYISQFNDMETSGNANQCSVYYKDENTSYGGHRGSKTFCFGYGYKDVVPNEYSSDCRPQMTFSDATKEAVIDHMWVTNSTYTALAMMNGYFVATKFSYEKKSYLKLTATGYKADGTETQTAEVYLADFRTETSGGIVTEWIKFDLSSLGSVNKIVFNIESSDVGEYGLNTPAYFCMDDVAVRVQK